MDGKKGGQQRESHKRRPSQRLKKTSTGTVLYFPNEAHFVTRHSERATVAPINTGASVLEALQEEHSPSKKKVGHLWSIELTRPSWKKEACPVQAPCSTLPDSGCLRRRLITLQAGRAHCGQAASMDVLLN